MTKRNTKEVRAHPAERSPWTQAPSSKLDQNEQNSKLTDGAYFWLDGYVTESNSQGGSLSYLCPLANRVAPPEAIVTRSSE